MSQTTDLIFDASIFLDGELKTLQSEFQISSKIRGAFVTLYHDNKPTQLLAINALRRRSTQVKITA